MLEPQPDRESKGDLWFRQKNFGPIVIPLNAPTVIRANNYSDQMDLQAVLSRFQNPKRNGKGYKVRCPVHNDVQNSLHISKGATGKILLHCMAGCETKQVIDVLGLTWGDLSGTDDTNEHKSNRDPVVKEYIYVDEAGDPLFKVSRTQAKVFFQSRFDPTTKKYISGMENTRRVPYRLPEVIPAENIFIVEGEKDADGLAALGLVATTNPGGAGQWNPEFKDHFHGKNVVILPDNDGPGKAHAEGVHAALLPVAKSVRIVALPNTPEKGDVSDFLAQYSKEQLLACVNQTTSCLSLESTQGKNTGPQFVTAGELLEATSDDSTRWILEDCLAAGTISALVAKPKVGKTTIAADLAISVARGEPFLGRATRCSPVAYVFLDGPWEDIADTFRRLGLRETDPIYFYAGSVPTEPIDWILNIVKEKGIRLVIVDVLHKLCRFEDIGDYAEVSRKMEPLLEAARSGDCHIMTLHHAKKEAKDDLDAAIGSTAIRGQTYTYLFAKRLPNSERRILSSDQRGGKNFAAMGIGFDATGRLCAEGTIDDVEIEEAIPAIRKVLDGSEPQTEKEVRAAVPMRGWIVGRALRALVDQGELERSGTGKRGNAFRFALAPGLGAGSSTPTPSHVSYTHSRPEGGGLGEGGLGLESKEQGQAAENTEENSSPNLRDQHWTSGTAMGNEKPGLEYLNLSEDWEEAAILQTKNREHLGWIHAIKEIFPGARVIK